MSYGLMNLAQAYVTYKIEVVFLSPILRNYSMKINSYLEIISLFFARNRTLDLPCGIIELEL